ncbi:MAG TPA: FecR domain-containing protein [Candidatus Brocadiaceae bacterium]
MQNEEIRDFIRRYSTGQHTEEEHERFVAWLKAAPIEQVEAVADQYNYNVIEDSNIVHANTELIHQIEAALNQYDLGKGEKQKTSKVVSMQKFLRVSAAASIILAITIGSYLIFFSDKGKKGEVAKGPEVPNDVKAPLANRAMITMPNGKTVYLDSAANGTLTTIGNVQLVKLEDGKIAYNGSTSEVLYNTLTNPRGSKVIDMTLADGSRVSLNAGSSVTYPITFVGPERKVSITGEAYFEVEHDATKPFIVSKGKTSIEVLGTHFNVNAYDDEADIKVTLLEGSVKVASPNPSKGGAVETVIIKPGQQAKAGVSGQLSVVTGVDIDEVMAWKNGKFVFGEKADIQTIMRQIARWYDVNVEYKGTVNGFIGGSISRNVNISNVLTMLEKTGEVKFKIEGNKITVLP